MIVKKIFISTVFLVISSSLFSQTIALKAKVDERCELLSTVFRLAEAVEYMQNKFPAFVDSVSMYFEPYKNHKVVEYSKMYREKYSVAYNAPMDLAVHLQLVDGKISFIPNVKNNSLEYRWNRDSLPLFIALLNDFYTTTKFHDFFQKQTIKEKVENAANKYFEKTDMEWFSNFFGEVPEGSFNLVISLSNGSFNYAAQVVYLDNKEDLYSIIICGRDSLNNPVFEDRWAWDLIIHEFCHSFVNYLIDKNNEAFRESGETMFSLLKDKMSSQAYSTWEVMMYEALVRAAVIKYIKDHDFEQSLIEGLTNYEKECGFFWIEELVAELGKYDKQRNLYPTLESYMPKLVEAYKIWAKKI